MIRDYLFDIGKIAEGAANGDYGKVAAYLESLGSKLEAHGEGAAAKRIRQILGKSPAGKVSLARAGQLDHMPVDSESRIPVADEERLAKGDVAIVLSQEAQATIDEFLMFFRAADRLIANGVGISPSLLMYGPPGVGKTQLARFIASELDYPLITARSDALISSYLGSTAKNIRMLFEHAASRPCVFFLDEFDAIAKMRDDERELGELKRVVISLMQNIDAMGRDHVLLAATNHHHLLDPAIWRRFAYKLELGLPDFSARCAMLRHFLGKFAGESTIEVAAAFTDGLSGAQLRDLCETLIRKTVIANADSVSHHDIIDRIAGPVSLREKARALRKADRKKFTEAKIGKLLNKSQSRVHELLSEDSEDAA